MRGMALTIMLALAACSGGDKGGGNSSGMAASGSQTEAEPDNASRDLQNDAIPVRTPSPTPISAIPAAFQGRWGLVEADCDRAKADIAKGLMTIAGNRLSFYESRSTASGLRQLGTDSIGLDLPMSGEGMTWSEPTRLTLQEGGRTLVRQVTGSPDRAGAFTYQRCPA